MIKTRVQTYDLVGESQPLLQRGLSTGQTATKASGTTRRSTLQIAKDAYRTEGAGVFFKGIGVCSARAFIVNAVQWAVSNRPDCPETSSHLTPRLQVYEWVMGMLAT